jgi:hypothetical protein
MFCAQNLYINVFPHEVIAIPQLVRVSSRINEIKVECNNQQKQAVRDVKNDAESRWSKNVRRLRNLPSTRGKGPDLGDADESADVHSKRHLRSQLLKWLDGGTVLVFIIFLVFIGLISSVLEQSVDS